jgi:light-independent protochlorophyllide reductase subunit B
VISSPLHVQDVPARFSPQMGWEGANVMFDTWVHPLMMGLEEHLIGMFRHDFEFVEGHRSHLGEAPKALASNSATVGSSAAATALLEAPAPPATSDTTIAAVLTWTADGEAGLARIPFFVRGKVRRNTETYAKDQGITAITEEVLYDAKAHFSR